MANLLNIVVWHCFPPIPTREFDYAVHLDGDEERAETYGWGATEAEARAEFGDKLIDRIDDHVYDLEKAGEIDKETALACYDDIDGLAWIPR